MLLKHCPYYSMVNINLVDNIEMNNIDLDWLNSMNELLFFC